jgi:hypothetical protein
VCVEREYERLAMYFNNSRDEFQTSVCSQLGLATGCLDTGRSVTYISHSRSNCRPAL